MKQLPSYSSRCAYRKLNSQFHSFTCVLKPILLVCQGSTVFWKISFITAAPTSHNPTPLTATTGQYGDDEARKLTPVFVALHPLSSFFL